MLFFTTTSLVLKVSTSNFKYIFLIINQILCDKVHNSWSKIFRFISLWTSLRFKVSTSSFKYIFLIITHMLCDMLCDKVYISSVTISRIFSPWTWNLYKKKYIYTIIDFSFIVCLLYCVQYLISRASLWQLLFNICILFINLNRSNSLNLFVQVCVTQAFSCSQL
jgi:hypothetical protein